MRLAVMMTGLMLAAPALAGDSDCRRAVAQSEMTRCADQDFRAADARLNVAYVRLIATLDDGPFKARLRMAQRAWLQYRDHECTYETADNEGGSIHAMVYAACLARLTRERTRILEQQLACWQNAERCAP